MDSFLEQLTVLPTPVQALLTPINGILFAILLYLTLNLLPSLPADAALPSKPTAYNWRPPKHQPSLLWRQYSAKQLAVFDGNLTADNPDGRILFAIRRKVYDVTQGRNFYGPGEQRFTPQSPPCPTEHCETIGGPYESFAGRDASRGLAKQSFDEDMLTPLDHKIDPLDDLVKSEWTNLRDWECELIRVHCGPVGTALLTSSLFRSYFPEQIYSLWVRTPAYYHSVLSAARLTSAWLNRDYIESN